MFAGPLVRWLSRSQRHVHIFWGMRERCEWSQSGSPLPFWCYHIVESGARIESELFNNSSTSSGGVLKGINVVLCQAYWRKSDSHQPPRRDSWQIVPRRMNLLNESISVASSWLRRRFQWENWTYWIPINYRPLISRSSLSGLSSRKKCGGSFVGQWLGAWCLGNQWWKLKSRSFARLPFRHYSFHWRLWHSVANEEHTYESFNDLTSCPGH